MSDNKKYYYLKLKDNYFERDNVKVLESMKNGHLYSLILLKLYLKAVKHDGALKMTDAIPYSPENVEILSSVINHDIDNVKETIRLAVKLDLITVLDSGEIWMTDIQNFIGKSSTEADRIREYRNKITNDVQMYDKPTPEIEIELKKEKDLEADKQPVSDHLLLTEKEQKELIEEYGETLLHEVYEEIENWIYNKQKGKFTWKDHKRGIKTWIKRKREFEKGRASPRDEMQESMREVYAIAKKAREEG